jgi:uncharacterized repeat protein (TIGR01451 family)
MLESFTRPGSGGRRLRALSGALIVGTIAATVGLVVANFAGAAKVVPELSPGAANKTCGELDGPGQDWLELKVDPNANGTYTQGPLTVTVSNSQNDKTFDWTSNIGVDAVFVKAGSEGSYIYRYDPPGEEMSDTGLTSPGATGNGISHIAFCYDLVSRIIVEKQTIPDGDPQSFDFTSDYDDPFALVDGEQEQSTILDPGTYSVSEDVPAGWELTSATCSDGSSPSAIAVSAGEIVKCTFTNTKLAEIVVTKQTIPDDHPEVFGFTGEIVETLGDGESESKFVPAGTYTVTESLAGHPVWALLDIDCDDADSTGNLETLTATYVVGVGETVECTFTNEKRGLITVVKQTTPDGDPQSFAFDASWDADGFSLTDGQSITSEPIGPGTFSVSEEVPAGWELTSATCSDGSPIDEIELSRNEHVTCTFRNTKNARIVVEKQTLPNGDSQVFSFAASYDADGFSLSDGQQNDSGDLDPGTYSVSETVPAGWDLKSAICSDQSPVGAISLQAGEVVTCVFTNEKDARIVVEKQTLPNGDAQSFHFDASYDADGFDLVDGGQNDSGDLDPGTYSVSEDVPAGWDLESAVCSDQSPVGAISLQAGEVVTCVFTNEKDARIVVEKQTLPNGDSQVFSFTAGYDADGFSLSDGQSNDSGDLDPGTYSVSETVPAGWDLKSAVCSDQSPAGAISLQAGEVVTCVFTNEKDAKIIVEKQTLPNGDPQVFSFTAGYDADGFSLSDGQQNDSGDLDPGTYSVSETVPAGWDLESAVCSDQSPAGAISLQAGEVVTCVFTNTKVPPPGAINVIKTANPTSLKEPGGLVSFTVEIQNTSQVDVVITSVVDDKFGNLANVAGGSPAGCFALPLQLAPGASSTCTFPKEVTGTAGTSHVNTVTASGFDARENPVSDSDDATVTFTERLIDLVIVKDATSPTPLNGTVTYTMTVTNKGPDTATNVQLADPAPAGITYLSSNPGAPTCTVTASLLTCSLGTLAVGESRQVTLTARATLVGQHTNTATVTGSGGRETNPADNVDTALTIVPQPLQPPTPKPKPKPKPRPAPEVCLTLTVTPKMVTADGRPDTVKVRVTSGTKRVKGTKVRVFGAGVKKTSKSKANGIATVVINPRRPGVITITAVETKNRQVCGPRRIGAVGVFLPPLTG